MKEDAGIREIHLEVLRATAAIRGVAARVVLSGTADTRATEELGVLLQEVHTRCTASGVRQVEVPFDEPMRVYTPSFERYNLELGRRMTIRDEALGPPSRRAPQATDVLYKEVLKGTRWLRRQ